MTHSNSSLQPPDPPTQTPTPGTAQSRLLKTLAAITAAALLACLVAPWLNLQTLASREVQLRNLCKLHPTPALAAAFAIYTAATGLSLPAATGLTLAIAWIFGFWPALLLVSFASTSGASLAFLASRTLLRKSLLQAYSSKLPKLQLALEQDGALYLLMLRLVPAMPFFLVNLLMGLTSIRLRTFWWASQLGMLPGTAVYVAAGASAPSLQQIADQGFAKLLSPQLLVALTALGIMPIAVRLASRRLKQSSQLQKPPAGSCSNRTR
jgi:uncharacterized membrane protein YdjX (TVP38/TMEM64 family)